MKLTLTEVASKLGVSVNQVRYIVKKKQVPYIRAGKKTILIDEHDTDLVRRRLKQ